MLELAETTRDGQLYTVVACLVYCAFTLEAYLNHLGKLRNKDWDLVERKYPKLEKYKMFASAADISYKFDARPYKTLIELFNFRDSMAHGKTTTETIQIEVEANDGRGADAFPGSDWQALATLERAQLSVADVEALVRELHLRSGFRRNPFETAGHGIYGVKSGDA